MNEKSKNKREWVKTAAIIFLSVMLVLTFFFKHYYELFASGSSYDLRAVRHDHSQDQRNRHGGER